MAKYDFDMLTCEVDELSYDKATSTFSAEASELGLEPGEEPALVVVINPKTKYEAHFHQTYHVFGGRRSIDRDWGEDGIFRYRAVPHGKQVFLNIFND
jgi:hypothetical protein